MSTYLIRAAAVLPAAACATRLSGADFYVSPSGTHSNQGSMTSPWDLQTALSHPAVVRPGDTIWMRGGLYSGAFNSTLKGSSNAPIVVRQYPGERATISGPTTTNSILAVNGTWTWYWGFEVTCADPNRHVGRPEGVSVYAANNRLINLVVHDAGEGVGLWGPASDAILYGSLIYYNGFEQSDRGHGHSVYAQNQTGTKHILDNILFKSFSEGIQIYGSSAAYLDNFDIQGNVLFDHGVPSLTGGAKDNILLGGGRVARNETVLDNYTYFSPGALGRNDIGYGNGCYNATVAGNYFAQWQALNLNCSGVNMSGNTFYGSIAGFTQDQFPSNTYHAGRPSGFKVFIRPNKYEPGRANIVVFNWDRLSIVPVDLSSVLVRGQTYEVRDAQNFYGPAVASGTYAGGTITLPALLTQVSPTVGTFPVSPSHSASEFNVYMLLPTSKADLTDLRQSGGSVMASGTSAVRSTRPVATQPAGQSPVFVKLDTTTQGNWRGVYGDNGFAFANTTSTLPSYAAVTLSGEQQYTWADSTTAPQALLRTSGDGRAATTWYSNGLFTIDVRILDGRQHNFAIYCLDWDGADGRLQQVELIDADTNALLDSRKIGSFSKGVYLLWTIKGHVVVRVTRIAGANAVVSGLFWSS